MQRPEFDDIKDYEEFSRYYWYREELIGICKAHGLKSDGSKIEQNIDAQSPSSSGRG